MTVGERGLQNIKAIPRILQHFSRCNITLDFIVQCTIRLILSRTCRVEFQHIGRLRAGRERDETMVKNFEDLQQVSKDNVDIAMKSVGAISKSSQAIAVEVADYSKK